MISDPKAWRVLSTLLLAVAVVGFVAGASGLAWWSLIGSGVTFAIELALLARERRGEDAPGGRR